MAVYNPDGTRGTDYFNPTIGINAYKPGMAPADVQQAGFYGYNDQRDAGGGWDLGPDSTPGGNPASGRMQAAVMPPSGPSFGYSPPSGAGGLGGFGGFGGGGGSSNPYLSGQADNIARRMTDSFKTNFMPGNNVAAMQAGGYGDNRQAILQTNGMRDLNNAIGDSLTGMYSADWNQDQNRGLQKYGMDQSYDINSQNTRNNFYTAQRGQDMQSVGLGADLMRQGQASQWAPITAASNVYSPYTGLGTTTNNQSSGGGLAGAAGGALGAGQLAKNLGWWG